MQINITWIHWMKFRIFQFFDESIRGRVLIQEIGISHYYIGLCITYNIVQYMLTKLSMFGFIKVAYARISKKRRKHLPISHQE